MGKFSEFITQFKHGWGKPREDAKDIEKSIKECYSKKDYDDVIELCSMLNWKQEEFDADLTFILCESIFQSSSYTDDVVDIAEVCANNYPESKERFYGLCGRSIKFTASSADTFDAKIELLRVSIDWFSRAKSPSSVSEVKQEIKDTYLKWVDTVQGDMQAADREKCIEIYNKAISESYHGSKQGLKSDDEFRKKCKQSIFDIKMIAVNLMIEEGDMKVSEGEISSAGGYYYAAETALEMINDDLWIAARRKPGIKKKEIDDKIFELMMLRVNDMVKQASIKLQSWNRMYGSFNLYDDALNLLDKLDCSSKEHRSMLKTRKKEISNKISESKKKIKPVEKELAKEFNKINFPSTKGYCNKIREEYPTLKDVMWASFSDLKDVYGMGVASESDLKNFLEEKKEELNEMLRNN